MFAGISALAASDDPLVTTEVFFDVSIGDAAVGRIVIGLFGGIAPKTVKNFVHYVNQEDAGKGYKESKFHRVIKNFMIQGGDFVNNDGSGVTNMFGGKYFDDEAFTLKHYGAGWLSMANAGANTNSCQFFITTVDCPWLDGKHVVFGKVVEGMPIIRAIEDVETDKQDHPTTDITVTNCGEIELDQPYRANKSAAEEDI